MKIKLLLIALLLIPTVLAVNFPQPTGYVNDFAGMIEQEWKEKTEKLIQEIEKQTTVEIAVVTVESLEGLSKEEYAIELAEKWGVGKAEKDNGLLLLIAKQEREYRFEIGYGLEGTINDAKAGRIGRNILVPYFKTGNYGEGVYRTVEEIGKLVGGEPETTAEYADEKKAIISDYTGLIVLAYFIFFTLVYGVAWAFDMGAKYKKGSTKKASIIKAAGDIIGLGSAFFIGIYIFLIVLVLIIIMRIRSRQKIPIGRGWKSVGGGFRGGGSSSFGSSGSSFGGGSFSGGGAGGRW